MRDDLPQILHDLGVVLIVDGDHLRWRAPRGAISEELLAEMNAQIRRLWQIAHSPNYAKGLSTPVAYFDSDASSSGGDPAPLRHPFSGPAQGGGEHAEAPPSARELSNDGARCTAQEEALPCLLGGSENWGASASAAPAQGRPSTSLRDSEPSRAQEAIAPIWGSSPDGNAHAALTPPVSPPGPDADVQPDRWPASEHEAHAAPSVEALLDALGPREALLASLTEDQREAYDERAGIMEFEGELPRAEAEALALVDVLGLLDARADADADATARPTNPTKFAFHPANARQTTERSR